ncbi:PREDICTED: uncharacterized protein LOC106116907 [Papilio xuthus]|uniref:Uncharacterized protein LOC106116907 n=1 Tax=Papilio xuthus TaxID=66420 RepID=A0AAJ6Z6S9_PAPXU|nr:PREDICTED: uncharacterized protein LOC106116907 [Papilio xuthus]
MKSISFDEWRFSACSITIMTRSTLIHGSCDDLRVLALRREGEPVITGRSRMPVRGNDTLARQVRGNLGVYLPAACRSPPDAACRSPLGARNMSFRYTPRRLPIAYSPGRNKWEGEVKRRRKRICCFQERLLWRSRSHRSSGVNTMNEEDYVKMQPIVTHTFLTTDKNRKLLHIIQFYKLFENRNQYQ